MGEKQDTSSAASSPPGLHPRGRDMPCHSGTGHPGHRALLLVLHHQQAEARMAPPSSKLMAAPPWGSQEGSQGNGFIRCPFYPLFVQVRLGTQEEQVMRKQHGQWWGGHAPACHHSRRLGRQQQEALPQTGRPRLNLSPCNVLVTPDSHNSHLQKSLYSHFHNYSEVGKQGPLSPF